MNDEFIVKICNLTIDFETIDGLLSVLRSVNIQVRQGEIVGLVGETGCGKSVTAKTLLGILPIPPALILGGEIYFLGKNLLNIDKQQRSLMKQKIAYIPQDPMASLNPVFSIGTIMVDMIIWTMSNHKLSRYILNRRNKALKKHAEKYSIKLLDKVHIADSSSMLRKYPSELSGGMRQRVLLAIALHGSPRLLVADEPTTALDVTIQKRTLMLFQEKINEGQLSGLYVTHNLGVARIICSKTYVMYAGTVVESAPTSELLDRPYHPYTKGLVESIPRLSGEAFKGIEGQIPDYLAPPSGCRFHPRCTERMKNCPQEKPPTIQLEENRQVACWHYQ